VQQPSAPQLLAGQSALLEHLPNRQQLPNRPMLAGEQQIDGVPLGTVGAH